MAPQHLNRVQKKWIAGQLRRAASLKTLAGLRKYQKALLDTILGDEKDTQLRSLTTGDATIDQVVEIFGLKLSDKPWEQREQTHDTPKWLTYSLQLLKKTHYDKRSEGYNRIAIEFLVIACMTKYQNTPSKLSVNDPTTTAVTEQSELSTNSPHDQTTTIIPILDQTAEVTGPSYIAPGIPLIAPQNTSQRLPIKFFPEMSLSVQVEKGGQEWSLSGIADWAIGYGDRDALEDGTVLLAIEAKQKENLPDAEAQLLACLATIRQLRIQANKKNVTTQGFLSDGVRYTFMCIRNNGTVMISRQYNLSFAMDLKSVFNFLLGMLITATESSPNTSPTKPRPEQDEEIENFDRDIFVRVFKDEDIDFDMPIQAFDQLRRWRTNGLTYLFPRRNELSTVWISNHSEKKAAQR